MNHIDGANAAERRMNAAHTLVVPYDADARTVRNAYRGRLVQRMELQNDDQESFTAGLMQLYDAKTIMSYPAGQQWRASIKLAFTTPMDRLVHNYVEYTDALLHDNQQPFDELSTDILRHLNSEFKKIGTRYNVLKASLVTFLGDLGAMLAPHLLQSDGSPVYYIVTGTVAAVAAGGMVAMKRQMNKHLRNIDILLMIQEKAKER